MKTSKQLGIWMDHSSANIMDFSNDEVESINLRLTPAFLERIKNLRLDESRIHNKERNMQSDFYKKLSHIIIDYDEVLLFGPTDAKIELFNMLRGDHRFERVVIHVESTDKLNGNAQESFMKRFFGR